MSSKTTPGAFRFVRAYLPERRAFIGLLALTLLATVLELSVPLVARDLIDQLTVGSHDLVVTSFLALLVILAALAEYLASVQASRMGLDTVKGLRFRLIGHLVRVQTISLHQHHSSELAARVMADSEELNQVFSTDLAALVGGVLSFVAVLGVLLWLDWRLTLVILGCLLGGAILITPIALSMSGLNKLILQSYADLTRQCSEWFRHHELVKVYGADHQVDAQARQSIQQYRNLALREARGLSLIGPISNLALMASLIILIATSTYWIADGSMTMGTFTAFLLYLFGLAFPLISMGMFFANYQKACGAAARLQTLLDLPLESPLKTAAEHNISALQVQGADLSLDGHRILRQLQLPRMHKGLVIISGPSGSGKTSLFRVLLGLYALDKGEVRVNDIPLQAEQLASLRGRMAWVEQEPALFQATVRENLCLGQQGIASELVYLALIEAGLEPWLTRIGGNLELPLTEQNHQLSGGEKQRFALARALVRPFDVLLLDEPTSALDKANAQQLMNKLREIAKHKLVLMISHDKSLFYLADQVLEMENGQLAENAAVVRAAAV
ncbi:ABC transporter ATP-binding protein [Bowmanella denitrificans]|uniref:ABC transporter ATP-binding protein n=1 Tax=Bowmanella denitrificans TaxID=366582 RepID=UPI000C9B8BBC|nr:ABC transporter ATP-binding protein [Bowmanella denitrificans]